MTKHAHWGRTGSYAVAAVAAAVLVSGCAGNEPDNDTSAAGSEDHGGHAGMEHPADGGPAPEGMTVSTDPAYPVGSEVVLTAEHMDGMSGATATIVGAYDTYTYSVDYTPTTGGEPVTDHRWVVQEELQGAGDERLSDDSPVTLAAEHMDGMDGAEATIASSTDETVYVVDFEADGMSMTNHKWVTESEIEPAP